MHSTDNVDDGYIGSGKRLWHSINHHGIENHKFEILELCEDRTQLAGREREIVNQQLLENPLCLNLKVGGIGGWGAHSDEAKKKISLTQLKDASLFDRKTFNLVIHRHFSPFKKSLKEENSPSSSFFSSSTFVFSSVLTSSFTGSF